MFYAINFTLLVGFVIALFVLQFKGPADALKYVRAAADASAFTLTFILSIGFLVYGIAMYRVLRKANAESSIWKVRFTQVWSFYCSNSIVYDVNSTCNVGN